MYTSVASWFFHNDLYKSWLRRPTPRLRINLPDAIAVRERVRKNPGPEAMERVGAIPPCGTREANATKERPEN